MEATATPQQLKEQLDALAVILSALVQLTENKIIHFIYDLFKTYKDQDWFVAFLTFVFNKFTSGTQLSLEEVQQAAITFSNE